MVIELHRSVEIAGTVGAGFGIDALLNEGVLYGDWHGRYPYRDFTELVEGGGYRLKPPEFFWQKMREDEISGLVLSKDGAPRYYPRDPASFDPWFERVFSNRQGVLMIPRDLIQEDPD